VTAVCNRTGLPFEGGFFEMKLKRTDLATLALFLTIFIFFILVALFLSGEGWISDGGFWTIIILSMLLPIYSTLNYAKVEHRP
jgi:hypothetical protein